MVPDLSRIIKYSSFARMDDLFESLRLMIGTSDESVQIVHIGLVMLARVELESLLRDMWSESIECVCERWTSEHRSRGLVM